MADTVTVRMFGKLHTLRCQRNLPTTAELDVPPTGVTAEDLALQLQLPLEDVEAVFCNHRACSLDHVVRPGDAIAFVPRGTPGPHRFTLGIYEAGRDKTVDKVGG